MTRAWYQSEHVWQVTPEQEGQDAITTSELYLASCAPQTIDVDCPQCSVRTVHVEQARVHSAPNVLLMQIRRTPGQPRIPVHVEEQFEVPGFPSMELAGIVYHVPSMAGGHYTALCRGPQGGFWYYDDSAPGQRKREDVGQIKPREVYMVAYCRRGGAAELAMQPHMHEVVDLAADVDMEAGEDAWRDRVGGDARPRVPAEAAGVGVDVAVADPAGAAGARSAAAVVVAAANRDGGGQAGRDGRGTASAASLGFESEPVILDEPAPEQEAKRRRRANEVYEVEDIVSDNAG